MLFFMKKNFLSSQEIVGGHSSEQTSKFGLDFTPSDNNYNNSLVELRSKRARMVNVFCLDFYVYNV